MYPYGQQREGLWPEGYESRKGPVVFEFSWRRVRLFSILLTSWLGACGELATNDGTQSRATDSFEIVTLQELIDGEQGGDRSVAAASGTRGFCVLTGMKTETATVGGAFSANTICLNGRAFPSCGTQRESGELKAFRAVEIVGSAVECRKRCDQLMRNTQGCRCFVTSYHSCQPTFTATAPAGQKPICEVKFSHRRPTCGQQAPTIEWDCLGAEGDCHYSCTGGISGSGKIPCRGGPFGFPVGSQSTTCTISATNANGSDSDSASARCVTPHCEINWLNAPTSCNRTQAKLRWSCPGATSGTFSCDRGDFPWLQQYISGTLPQMAGEGPWPIDGRSYRCRVEASFPGGYTDFDSAWLPDCR